MKIRIIIPANALIYIYGVDPTFSLEAYYRIHRWTDAKFRQAAYRDKTTITAAVRVALVKMIPGLAEHWPPRVPTAAQLRGALSLQKHIPEGIPQAARLIRAYLSGENDGHTARRAREWLEAWEGA